MNRFSTACILLACAAVTFLSGAVPLKKAPKGTTKAKAKTKSTSAARKKKAAKARTAPISAATRAAAHTDIETRMAAVDTGIENPAALTAYFSALSHSTEKPVHILQFGDSHTASDDWVNAMRTATQTRYGNGGPGYIHPGHPFLGYRRFDASGANSAGWKTDGNKSQQLDPDQGLSHISISTRSPGQTVKLAASGESLGLFFLRQPGGGQLELTFDGDTKAVVSTDGEAGPGEFFQSLSPGHHEVLLRTMNFAPVRLFGWTLDNGAGVTFETLGINGALANKILDSNEAIWAAELARRAPALIVLAYGTNEANSRLWAADQYRADLTAIIARIRRAAPEASILMVGPPDCGKLKPLLHLGEVVAAQREIATSQGVAFWDWRMHMGGDRIVTKWVQAGLGQADYVHLTGEGYRLIGSTLFDQLEKAHNAGQ